MLAGEDKFHIRRIGKHGDDDFTSFRDFFGIGRHLRAFFAQFLHRRAAAIVNDE